MVAAGEMGEARRARDGEGDRSAGDVDRRLRGADLLQQALGTQALDHLGEIAGRGRDAGDGRGGGAEGGGILVEQVETEQALQIVGAGAEALAAWDLLERRADAADQAHRRALVRRALAQAGQIAAMGAQDEGSLERIALGLLDRQGGEARIVQPAFAHHPIDQQAQLVADRVDRQRFTGIGRDFGSAGAQRIEGADGLGDGVLATAHGDIAHSGLHRDGARDAGDATGIADDEIDAERKRAPAYPRRPPARIEAEDVQFGAAVDARSA
jgi:hypothetical protein